MDLLTGVGEENDFANELILKINGLQEQLQIRDAEIELLKASRAAAVSQEQTSRVECNRLRGEVAELKRQLAEAQAGHDKEIRDFQNDARNYILELTGAPDSSIDGKGSDAGWQEFTLAEISQGIRYLLDKLAEAQKDRDEAQAACAELRDCFIPNPASDCSCPHCTKVRKALSTTCGRPLLDELERYRKAMEFYRNERNWEIGTAAHHVTKSAIEEDGGQLARNALNP